MSLLVVSCKPGSISIVGQQTALSRVKEASKWVVRVMLSITVKWSRCEESKYEEHWLKRQVMRQDTGLQEACDGTMLPLYTLTYCGGNTFAWMSVPCYLTRLTRG